MKRYVGLTSRQYGFGGCWIVVGKSGGGWRDKTPYIYPDGVHHIPSTRQSVAKFLKAKRKTNRTSCPTESVHHEQEKNGHARPSAS